MKDKPLSIRVSYSVDPTPESDEYGVFVGSVVSDWVTSQPPHDWLFAQTIANGESARTLLHYPPEEVLMILCNEIETKARLIELNAKIIHEDPTVPSMALNKMSTGETVGNVVDSILEYTGEIRKAIREKRIYLGARPHSEQNM